MGKKDKNKKNKNKGNDKIVSQENPNQKTSTTVIKGIVTTINTLISATFIIFLINFYGDFREVKTNVDNIKDNYITQVHISNIAENIDSLESDINGFKNIKNISIIYKPTNTTLQTLSTATANNNTNFLSSPSWSDNDIIAENPHTGRKYKAKDLKDQKILLPYKEDGQDVYFFGQFNKYNHWDGNCIINVYNNNNKLLMIMEGRYNDGELLSYKQVISYKNSSGTKVWSISKREVNGDINSGESYTYYKTKNKKSNFTEKTVETSDILSVLDFESWLDTPLEGYYYGNTSNGNYNDDTGKSYLIKYNHDGTIRTLYCGKFTDGVFDDNTGNAWYISLDEENSTYVYYKGKFSDNKPLETKENKRENISNKKIRKIIDGMNFNSSTKLYNDVDKSS